MLGIRGSWCVRERWSNMNSSSDSAVSSSAGGAANDARSIRRRLLRGGLAAPVLMTVANRPALANVCTTSSAHTSMSGSRLTTTESCSGRTPTYWLSQTSRSSGSSTSAYLMESTRTVAAGDGAVLFGSVFGSVGGYETMTFQQVLEAGHLSTGKVGLAAHLVAAVLNSKAGYTPVGVLDVAKAQSIWSDYSHRGWYEPTAGVKWYEAELIDWLKTTMPLSA
jgi:hypothetical protein